MKAEADADDAAADALYLPAGQAVHDVAAMPEIDPGAQAVQVLASEPLCPLH